MVYTSTVNITNQSDLVNFLNDSSHRIGIVENDIGISKNNSVLGIDNFFSKILKTDNTNSAKLYFMNAEVYNLIRSKNNITDGGFQIGNYVDKDMNIDVFDYELTPADESDLFPTSELPSPPQDSNIIAGDKSEENRLNSSYWNDWEDDVFDDWGFFYIYDTNSGTYYFPLFDPINENDGVLTTQVFNAFNRQFTIIHGYCVEGIFKIEISVNDDLPFRFGAYGNMGSDGDEVVENFTQAYSLGSNNLTLYYRKDAEDGDDTEILYTYVIPKKISENDTQPYVVNYNGTDMSLITRELTRGVIIYFAKTNDVKDWVLNDLEFV